MHVLLIGFSQEAVDWTELLDVNKCRIAHSANCASAIEELLRPECEYNRVVLRTLPDQWEGAAAFVASVRAMGKHLPVDIVIHGTDLNLENRGGRQPHAFSPSRRTLSNRSEVVIEYHAPCYPATRKG